MEGGSERECAICEEAPAEVWCGDCGMALCHANNCFRDLHRPAKMAGHTSSPLPREAAAGGGDKKEEEPQPLPLPQPQPQPHATPAVRAIPAARASAQSPRRRGSFSTSPRGTRNSLIQAVAAAAARRPRSQSLEPRRLGPGSVPPTPYPPPTSSIGLRTGGRDGGEDLGAVSLPPSPAASVPPSGQSTVRQPTECEVCEDQPAELSCADCDMVLCPACDEQLHRPAKLARHERLRLDGGATQQHRPGGLGERRSISIQIQSPRTVSAAAAARMAAQSGGAAAPAPRELEQQQQQQRCDNCEEADAYVHCDECGVNLCRENGCDEEMHMPRKCRTHTRRLLDGSGGIVRDERPSPSPVVARRSRVRSLSSAGSPSLVARPQSAAAAAGHARSQSHQPLTRSPVLQGVASSVGSHSRRSSFQGGARPGSAPPGHHQRRTSFQGGSRPASPAALPSASEPPSPGGASTSRFSGVVGAPPRRLSSPAAGRAEPASPGTVEAERLLEVLREGQSRMEREHAERLAVLQERVAAQQGVLEQVLREQRERANEAAREGREREERERAAFEGKMAELVLATESASAAASLAAEEAAASTRAALQADIEALRVAQREAAGAAQPASPGGGVTADSFMAEMRRVEEALAGGMQSELSQLRRTVLAELTKLAKRNRREQVVHSRERREQLEAKVRFERLVSEAQREGGAEGGDGASILRRASVCTSSLAAGAGRGGASRFRRSSVYETGSSALVPPPNRRSVSMPTVDERDKSPPSTAAAAKPAAQPVANAAPARSKKEEDELVSRIERAVEMRLKEFSALAPPPATADAGAPSQLGRAASTPVLPPPPREWRPSSPPARWASEGTEGGASLSSSTSEWWQGHAAARRRQAPRRKPPPPAASESKSAAAAGEVEEEEDDDDEQSTPGRAGGAKRPKRKAAAAQKKVKPKSSKSKAAKGKKKRTAAVAAAAKATVKSKAKRAKAKGKGKTTAKTKNKATPSLLPGTALVDVELLQRLLMPRRREPAARAAVPARLRERGRHSSVSSSDDTTPRRPRAASAASAARRRTGPALPRQRQRQRQRQPPAPRTVVRVPVADLDDDHDNGDLNSTEPQREQAGRAWEAPAGLSGAERARALPHAAAITPRTMRREASAARAAKVRQHVELESRTREAVRLLSMVEGRSRASEIVSLALGRPLPPPPGPTPGPQPAGKRAAPARLPSVTAAEARPPVMDKGQFEAVLRETMVSAFRAAASSLPGAAPAAGEASGGEAAAGAVPAAAPRHRRPEPRASLSRGTRAGGVVGSAGAPAATRRRTAPWTPLGTG